MICNGCDHCRRASSSSNSVLGARRSSMQSPICTGAGACLDQPRKQLDCGMRCQRNRHSGYTNPMSAPGSAARAARPAAAQTAHTTAARCCCRPGPPGCATRPGTPAMKARLIRVYHERHMQQHMQQVLTASVHTCSFVAPMSTMQPVLKQLTQLPWMAARLSTTGLVTWLPSSRQKAMSRGSVGSSGPGS